MPCTLTVHLPAEWNITAPLQHQSIKPMFPTAYNKGMKSVTCLAFYYEEQKYI